jgi:hypothetical protein
MLTDYMPVAARRGMGDERQAEVILEEKFGGRPDFPKLGKVCPEGSSPECAKAFCSHIPEHNPDHSYCRALVRAPIEMRLLTRYVSGDDAKANGLHVCYRSWNGGSRVVTRTQSCGELGAEFLESGVDNKYKC